MYHTLKSNGVPDSNIVLMLADDLPCNARNSSPGSIFTERNHGANLYENVQVDYRGSEVTVANFLRVMTGRHLPGTPPSQSLNVDDRSNILLYMTGHGGDQFLKFQDSEEIAADDFRDMFEEMKLKGRYKSALFITDTCQAGTLADKLSKTLTPDVFFVGSSRKNENSYAHHSDSFLGVAVIDRFTRSMLQFFSDHYTGEETMADLLKFTDKPKELRANLAVSNFFEGEGSQGFEGEGKGPENIRLADYFSNEEGGADVGGGGYEVEEWREEEREGEERSAERAGEERSAEKAEGAGREDGGEERGGTFPPENGTAANPSPPSTSPPSPGEARDPPAPPPRGPEPGERAALAGLASLFAAVALASARWNAGGVENCKKK